MTRTVADELDSLRVAFLAGVAGALVYASHDGRKRVDDALRRQGDHGIVANRMDGPPYLVPVGSALSTAGTVPSDRLISARVSVLALELGRQLAVGGLFDRDPAFEFARHVRNAVAHGDVFDIRGVSRRAEFNRWTITPELTGTPLYDFLGPGDVLDL